MKTSFNIFRSSDFCNITYPNDVQEFVNIDKDLQTVQDMYISDVNIIILIY